MSTSEHPVTVAVRRGDGSVEQVRVGTALRNGDNFTLQMGELSIGGTPLSPASADFGQARRAVSAGAPGDGPTVFPPYGRSKGAPIQGASEQDLDFYANGARRSLADPSKSRWHDKERALLAVIEAEVQRQRGGGGSSGGGMDLDEPPPLGDDDAPF